MVNITSLTPAALMEAALCEAKRAYAMGEVPVGAVVAVNQKIIARAHNLTESHKDPTAHAETLALREAARALGNWRLSDVTLCVTLEPCTMCIGAIKLARVSRLIFGAADSRAGAIGSLYDLAQDTRTGEPPRIICGVLEQECAVLLQQFFTERRGVTAEHKL